MKFQSKVDWWYYLVVLVFAGATIAMSVSGFAGNLLPLMILSAFFILIFVLLILPIAFFSFCTLEEDFLFIRCGLCRLKIPYKNILYVEPTRDPSSSMAPSFDRLGIEYRTGDGKNYVMVAPKEKEKFIKEIRNRNPLIAYKPEA